MKRILIANRGEIAVRIIRTARELGFETVAVFSDADRDALHVKVADHSIAIGAAVAADSYLRIDKLLAAASASGCDAIHPGYGFLSENAEFARACASAGLIFIGPGADAIELMGSKRLSKLAMIAAGVPCIPGYQGDDQSDDHLIAKASEIGAPLMVKASAGGGGRGMRLVESLDDLAASIKAARSEAIGAFGSGELILEKAVIEPRHIEIQIFADQHGNVVHLGERDCSIQRRHQKVVEEAPSPFVDKALRQQMGEAAVNAAQSCDYCGAGTVEFLVDQDKNFYFLEMNTRLQVEHPVTESITGQDLVAWQLLVAQGDKLPLSQQQINFSGHAIEVRLYAEDPRDQFMPQTGNISFWSVPQREGLRVDTGVQTGSSISPFYDPMLAKIIAYGSNRDIALRRLLNGLQDIALLGVNNNKHFLQRLLQTPAFMQGNATTALIAQHFASDSSMQLNPPPVETLAVAAALISRRGCSNRFQWSSASAPASVCDLQWRDTIYSIALTQSADSSYQATISSGAADKLEHSSPASLNFSLSPESGNCSLLSTTATRGRIFHSIDEDTITLDLATALGDAQGHYQFNNVTYRAAQSHGASGTGQLKAAMDGAIIELLVAEGDAVVKGQTLAVMEAMKMEHPLKADIDGVVEGISVSKGQQLKARQLLLTITPAEHPAV